MYIANKWEGVTMEQDINSLIEELTKVRPDELSTEGLKLFNKINEIIFKLIIIYKFLNFFTIGSHLST